MGGGGLVETKATQSALFEINKQSGGEGLIRNEGKYLVLEPISEEAEPPFLPSW